MDDRGLRPLVTPVVAVVLAVGVGAGTARAHEVAGSRFAAPIPLSLLFAGAGATVATTALWLAVTERAASSPSRRRHVLTIPAAVARPARRTAQAAFLAVVGATLVAGLLGPQVAAENLATVFTWPVWFRGVALVAILVGNPWGTLSPWRTLYRALARIEGRPPALVESAPAALGAWPAVVGFTVLLGVVANLTVVPRSPRLTTVVVATYGLVMIGGAALFGASWLHRADPLGVFYGLVGRVAPLELSTTDDGGCRLAVRPPWRGCLAPVGSAALVVFVVATVYTVSFDGFTDVRLFQTALFGVRDALGTGPGTSLLLYLVGLGGFVATFCACCLGVERLGAGTASDWVGATRWFAPTVLPIAAAYEVAHNYPFVLRNLGHLPAVASRWLLPAVGPIDPLWWLSLPVFWGSQVLLVVVGHVVAVVAAHRVAVERYDAPADARRGHLPLVGLMVAYTVVSLWIISQPVVSG